VLPGASFFSSSASFGIVRGGHLDLTILGALEVAANGDIANWIVPGVKIKGMGGAMDLLASRSKVIVGMEHSNKSGEFKLLEKCKLPLTARDAVSMVVTEKAVLQRVDGRLKLTEVAKGETFDSVQKLTGFKLEVHGELKEF
jgi:3-oxoacid CoA-transferase B subunit